MDFPEKYWIIAQSRRNGFDAVCGKLTVNGGLVDSCWRRRSSRRCVVLDARRDEAHHHVVTTCTLRRRWLTRARAVQDSGSGSALSVG